MTLGKDRINTLLVAKPTQLFTVTLPNGDRLARKSSRNYTHVVIGHWTNETAEDDGHFSWHGSAKAAAKSALKYRGLGAIVRVMSVDSKSWTVTLHTPGHGTSELGRHSSKEAAQLQARAASNYGRVEVKAAG